MIVLCAPDAFSYRARLRCPTCRARRRHVVAMFVWYSSEITCLGCGDAWSEGQLRERPFRRGWRQESIARAQHEYEQATTKDVAMAALMREVARVV